MLDIITSSVCQGLHRAVQESCSIAVLPFGGRDMNEPAINQVLNEVTESGMVLVAAAGNDGPSMG